jgi:hypothetical protein
MSDEKSNGSASGGIGIGTCFALLFTGLKLTGYIDWSWLWVLAPLWGPLAFILVVIVIAMIVMLVKGAVY